ncbi:MAG TPA: PHP domain-containing protein [Candidatus Hydrogenedentes bacterium]|nr:PHP domain-containing protein [Candidatus Hydrogenedentota bacterium]
MMAGPVDLHLHSNQSDGADPPADVVARAAHLHLSAIALTDHDAVSGLCEARDVAHRCGLDFLDGVEISASFARHEVHVVGLGIRQESQVLADMLGRLQRARNDRAEQIARRLGEAGVPLDMTRVRAGAGGKSIGRLHIAREMHAVGVVKTVQKAFTQYIGKGRCAYVPKQCVPCFEAIEVIHAAGGLAFVAHPGIGKDTQRLLPQLLALPFDGIEVYHTKHSAGQVEVFLRMATERGLLISGGSDCHGASLQNPAQMGKVLLPRGHFERITEALERD